MATVTADPALPVDPALPGMELLHQPARLREHVSRVLAGRQERVLEAGVSVRRFVAGKRCIVDLDLTIAAADGQPPRLRKLVAKLYNREQGAAVYDILQRLRERSFSGGRWLVPEPLDYDAVSRLLILNWSEGALLRSSLLAGADARLTIQSAAEWLARFHASGVTGGRCYSFSRQLHTLAGWKLRIEEAHPQAGPLLIRVLRSIEERGLALAGWTPGPTHRDFSPDHVLSAGEEVTVLDFDEYCQYDSLFDVAHFAAHVRFLGWTSGGPAAYFDDAADLFEAEYRARVAGTCEARLALYRAVSYCKLAHIVAAVKRPPDLKEMVDCLLGKALQQFQGEQK